MSMSFYPCADDAGDARPLYVGFDNGISTFRSPDGPLTEEGVRLVAKELSLRLCLGSDDAKELAGIVEAHLERAAASMLHAVNVGRRIIAIGYVDGTVKVAPGGAE